MLYNALVKVYFEYKKIGRNKMEAFKKELKYAIIPGILIGLMNGIGFFVKKDGGIKFGIVAGLYYVISIMIAILGVAVFFMFMSRCKEKKHRYMSDYISSSSKYMLIMFVLLIIFWIPNYLSVFPGIFSYDAPGQLMMYLENRVSVRHPVLHTVLMGKLIVLGYSIFGTLNMGVCFYFCFQLVFFAIMLSGVFIFLYEEKAPLVFHGIAFFIFTMYPPVTLHLISATKDNFFSLFLVDFLIINYKFIKNRDVFFDNKCNILIWVALALGTIIFRNNAVYVFIVCAPLWIWFAFKVLNKKKTGLLMYGAFIVCFLLYKYSFANLVASGTVDPREMLSVPIQQVTRVYARYEDELPVDEKNIVEKVFQGEAFAMLYNPQISDIPKYLMDYDVFLNMRKDCIQVYLRWFRRYPKEYVDSFLENTYGFWYMWPKLVLTGQGNQGFLVVEDAFPVSMESKIPFLLKVNKLFVDSKLVDGNYVWACLFMPATCFYIGIILFFYSMKQKDIITTASLFGIFVLWLTYLLGPVALVRYVLFLYLLIPVEFCMVYSFNNKVLKDK